MPRHADAFDADAADTRLRLRLCAMFRRRDKRLIFFAVFAISLQHNSQLMVNQ